MDWKGQQLGEATDAGMVANAICDLQAVFSLLAGFIVGTNETPFTH